MRKFSQVRKIEAYRFDAVATCYQSSRSAKALHHEPTTKGRCRSLRRMGFDGPVYLATDSPAAVREEFARIGEFIPIDPPSVIHPFEVVLILSRVDGLVIANSSFSWWTGFIGERPRRVVIAPRPWLTRSDIDTRDLLPPHWLTLDRESYE